MYQWLGVGRDFSNWIKDRIDKYDFTENLDFFIAFAKFGDGFDGLNKFDEFASQRNWMVYQKRARSIMATYDAELRSISHPKLIDYKKEFSQEDIQKLIG
ncbi:antA/AntB antirepressor family protein [Patescibacteria group bacterium]|nr:antA/AntB antirepressor family protein [Patescibacteria group bacterium]